MVQVSKVLAVIACNFIGTALSQGRFRYRPEHSYIPISGSGEGYPGRFLERETGFQVASQECLSVINKGRVKLHDSDGYMHAWVIICQGEDICLTNSHGSIYCGSQRRSWWETMDWMA